MSKKTFTIMGATGHIGRIAAEELLRKGFDVRALGRDPEKLALLRDKGAQVLSPSFERSDELAEAFRGTDGVFTLIPPSYMEDDFSAYQDRSGEAIATAFKKAGVSRAVCLSSIGADKQSGTGPITGLYRQERRLGKLPGLNVVHLRPAYFMENLMYSIPTIKGHGINGTPLRGDMSMPMVATLDIGHKVAELLERLEFKGASVLEFAGPREYTMIEATGILAKAIGKPGLPYVQFPYEDAKKAMLGMGMKPSIVGLMIEMNQAFNDGLVTSTQTWDGSHRGKTTLEEFAVGFAAAFAHEG